jgi:hypothetical protein
MEQHPPMGVEHCSKKGEVMSIEFLPYDTARCSLASFHSADSLCEARPRRTSPRRIAANRRNARRSTGPKTREGKLRSSRNALKHGLCSATAIPPCEDAPTFSIFLAELEDELQPISIMQKTLFPQIANLVWRLRRLPEAQAEMFQLELDKSADGEMLSPSQLIARRFSEENSNGFERLGRYERSMQNALLRLMTKYHYLKKHHPTTPYAPDEQPMKPQPAYPSDEEMAVQKETFDRRREELPLHVPPRNPYELDVDICISRMDTARAAAARAAAKRSQTNPTENRDFDQETEEIEDWHDAPRTERSQHSGMGASPVLKNLDEPR